MGEKCPPDLQDLVEWRESTTTGSEINYILEIEGIPKSLRVKEVIGKAEGS